MVVASIYIISYTVMHVLYIITIHSYYNIRASIAGDSLLKQQARFTLQVYNDNVIPIIMHT